MHLTIEPDTTPTPDSTLPEERVRVARVIRFESGPKYGAWIDRATARAFV